MTAARQQGQIDAWKRWHEKLAANPMTGSKELPYIKASRFMYRHKEMFKPALAKNKYGRIVCNECSEEMRLVIDEYYCEYCHASVMKNEVVQLCPI